MYSNTNKCIPIQINVFQYKQMYSSTVFEYKQMYSNTNKCRYTYTNKCYPIPTNVGIPIQTNAILYQHINIPMRPYKAANIH